MRIKIGEHTAFYNLGDLTPKIDGAYNLGSPSVKFDTAYAHSVPGVGSLIKKTEPGVADTIYGAATDSVPAAFFQSTWTAGFTADIAYQPELQPVKAASIFNNANLTVLGLRTSPTSPSYSR